MLSFAKTVRLHSEFRETSDGPLTYPGVSYVVRRLTVMERAERDLPIADHLSKFDDLQKRYLDLPRDRESDTSEQRSDREAIARDMMLIVNAHIKRPYLEAGLEAVEGLLVDDRPMTAAEFIHLADEALIDEAYIFCDLAARLPMEKLKNLQSPGTFSAAEPGTTINSTVEPASNDATT